MRVRKTNWDSYNPPKLQVSELLKILANYESPSCATNKLRRPPYITAPVSKSRQCSSYSICLMRGKAALPEYLRVLVNQCLERRDHLKESLSACITAVDATLHRTRSQKKSSMNALLVSNLLHTCPVMSRNIVSDIREQTDMHCVVPYNDSVEWTQQSSSQVPCKMG